ncbi:MAG: Unknown protein [uncultured Sulfurovum sp.]|uniref:Uncharacterized protein n=1 Tax=uncultured Sulfurovum sp. TaxID=269237 RepID=A0A6S6TRC3_9BACT|nr:MAG: Unknown protein [uncultured Sulfurovum sp.]
MQLKKSLTLSSITAALLVSSSLLHAENYVSVEYLQYDESDDRVSVSAPMVEASYDFNTDYNLKANFMFDAVSGATPSFMTNANGDLFKGLQEFEDRRSAASLMLTSRMENRDELYTGLDFSREEDYQSYTGSLEYMHYLDSTHNTALHFGGSVSYNEILVYDGETGASAQADYDGESGASHVEDSLTFNLELGATQVLSKDSSLKVSAFVLSDDGYLTNPHGIVIRDYNSINPKLETENRPDKRVGYGFVAQYNKLLTPDTSFVGSYRLYTDDWDVTSHTLEANIYTDVTQKLTLGAGLRYYTQTQAEFYNENIDHFTNETYASSDERLSDFDALTYKASLDYKQDETWSYNVGAQFYQQNTITEMTATLMTIGMKYKF